MDQRDESKVDIFRIIFSDPGAPGQIKIFSYEHSISKKAITNKKIFSERLKSLGLHDDKFSSSLVSQDRVIMFKEANARNRKEINLDCKKLFTDC